MVDRIGCVDNRFTVEPVDAANADCLCGNIAGYGQYDEFAESSRIRNEPAGLRYFGEPFTTSGLFVSRVPNMTGVLPSERRIPIPANDAAADDCLCS